MTKKLEGKIALITGGSSGIGLASAQAFAEEGAKVFITGRRQAQLDAAVKSIGKGVVGVRSDASKMADLDDLYAELRQRAGHLDVLFANAGVGDMAPIGSITEEQFDRTFNTNVKGVLFTVQKALPLLKDGGSVILMSSIVGTKGTETFSVYSASKAAVRNFARSWILDLKTRKIRVNAISPGSIRTPGLEGLVPAESTEGFFARLSSLTPMDRLGRPDEVAKAVVFLASDDSSFISGIELFVDGGRAQI